MILPGFIFMDTILDHTLESLKTLCSDMGHQAYRAEQVFDWIYRKKVSDISQMTNLPSAFREKIIKRSNLEFSRIVEKKVSRDKSVKFLFESEGTFFESVSITSDQNRHTFCISTQAGCPVGCAFCSTGLKGFSRNLFTRELISQVLLMENVKTRPDNIVLMGMGEPMLNFENVSRFVNIISDQSGYGFSTRRITVSSAGFLDELKSLHNLYPRVEIAISINASDDESRKKIMKHSGLASFSQIIKFASAFDNEITFEYVLLKDINDSIQDAHKLGKACTKLQKVKINLIRYNPTGGEYDTPGIDRALKFQDIVKGYGTRCFIRKSMGVDIDAACGQLAGRKINK